MSRAGEGGRLKKRNCCLTCAVVTFIFLIIFVAALYIGGSIMFKTYVSPKIGGLELNDAIALAANVFSGKETKADYTEADLDDFYSGLSEAMFLSEKDENELEYELVPDEKRATLAPAPAAAEKEGSSEKEKITYDEDAAYTAFCKLSSQNRYALLPTDVKAALTIEEYSHLAGEEAAAVAARDKVGLKTYRLSLNALLGDMDFGAEDFSMDAALERSLSSLAFDFDRLATYDYKNAAAESNEKLTSFVLNGREVGAFINDILTFMLSSESSPLTSELKDKIPEGVDIASFFKVASVKIVNTPLAVVNNEQLLNQKDTALGISISIRTRELVKAALETEEMKKNLSDVPAFALNLIPNLVPKFYSLHATVYPLAEEGDKREVVLMLNKPSEKNAQRLATLLNALLADDAPENTTFLGGINDQVVSVFSDINKTVKIAFQPSEDREGNKKDADGNYYSEMKIMTWDTVVSLIDNSGEISAHDVFTILKCLYDTYSESEIPVLTPKILEDNMDAFTADFAKKYGVNSSFFDENNIISDPSALSGVVNELSLKGEGFELKQDNEAMRAELPVGALAYLLKSMLSGEEAEEENSSVSADAPDSSTEESSGMDFLKDFPFDISEMIIREEATTGETKIFSLEIGISLALSDLVGKMTESEGENKDDVTSKLVKKLMPQGKLFFALKIYISESKENGETVHRVGTPPKPALLKGFTKAIERFHKLHMPP